MTTPSRRRKQAILERAVPVSEIASDPDKRGNRAMALMCAAVCWRGDPTDSEGMLSVADEFLQYIEGNDAMMPRPDKREAGYLPNPKAKR
jgi:hypothetical protein